MSSEIASRNLRRLSAARSDALVPSSFDNLVTPSTRRATSSPNRAAISSRVASVSSIVSCRMAVTTVAVSSFSSVRMPATSIG